MGNPRRRIRAAWRLFLVVKLTAFLHLALLVGSLVTLGLPRQRARWRHLCGRAWARSLLAAMGARVECRGRPPEPPFLLVANHLSYIDILILGSRVDGVFVAKSGVASWPIIGRLCRWMGTLFIDRRAHRDVPHVIEAIDRTLARGQGVVLFPESTSTRGEEVGTFHPALLEGAARSLYPASFASLSYATADAEPPAHLAICWWGNMEFRGHLWRLLALRGFRATVAFGDERIRDDDRKQLAARLWQAVHSLFTPVVGRARNAS